MVESLENRLLYTIIDATANTGAGWYTVAIGTFTQGETAYTDTGTFATSGVRVQATSPGDAIEKSVTGTATVTPTMGSPYNFSFPDPMSDAFKIVKADFDAWGKSHGMTGYQIRLEDLTGQPGNDRDYNDAYLPVTITDYTPLKGQCGCKTQDVIAEKTNAAANDPAAGDLANDPVRYFDGAAQYVMTDLESSGFGENWGQTRSWTQNTQFTSNNNNGYGWTTSQMPSVVQPSYDDSSLVVVQDDVNYMKFTLSGGSYTPNDFLTDALSHDSNTHLLKLTDSVGDTITFRDFDSSSTTSSTGTTTTLVDTSIASTVPTDFFVGYRVLITGGTADVGQYATVTGYNASTKTLTLGTALGSVIPASASYTITAPASLGGSFESFADPGGNKTSVTSRNSAGQITEVRRSNPSTNSYESWLYTYFTSGTNTGLLQNVQLRRSSDGSTWNVVRQVTYSYYDGSYMGDMTYGNLSDLRTAVIADGSGSTIDTDYYRYWTPTDANYGTSGLLHGLKFTFSSQSYDRLAASLATGSPLTATDAQVKGYADNYFEYDSMQRVTTEVVQGQGCSCSGSTGQGTYTYSYTTSNFAAGYNTWMTKTIETLPHDSGTGDQNIVYSNFAGEVILKVRVDNTTNASTPATWGWFYTYDTLGRQKLAAQPSAVLLPSTLSTLDGFSDVLDSISGNYLYLSDTSGLIGLTDYNGNGYYADTKLLNGETATAITQEAWDYTSHTSGGVTVYEIADDTVYGNSDGTDARKTSFAYTWGAGNQIASITTTAPPIAAAQNGPASSNTDTAHADVTTDSFDAYGRDVSSTDGDGFITTTSYDDGTGAVTKTVVDTATLALTTTYTIDGLGRTTKVVDPNGNVTYTVYKDTTHEVRVYPGWQAGTSTTTGPTQITREYRPPINSPSQAVYDETLATTDAPHTTGGIPDGTESVTATGIQSLSRNQLDQDGRVIETDDYVNLAGQSYSQTSVTLGTAGTNYYATKNFYDPRGRLAKVTAPTGTITHYVYDGLDRLISTWVGTNDSATPYWSPTNNVSPSNMICVENDYYDTQSAPDVPTLSSIAGGALVATTYYVRITYLINGVETAGSLETTLSVSASNLLKVTLPSSASASGATSYNVYVSTSSGGESLQNASPIAIGTTSWTEPTGGLLAGGQPSTGLTPSPATPTLSSTGGGSLAATTYFVTLTYVGASGESVPSAETSLAVSANNLLTVTSPAASSGYSGYNVYVSTASGAEIRQNTSTISLGTNWTESVGGLVAGTLVPKTSAGDSNLTMVVQHVGDTLNGQATATGSTTTLVDSNLSATGNYAGLTLSITGGTDAGQSAIVKSYSSSTHTLTLMSAFSSSTTSSSVFTLSTSADRVTQTFYDWRDRPVMSESGVSVTDTTTHRPIMYTVYDNMDEPIEQRQYDGAGILLASLGAAAGVPNPPSSTLLRVDTSSSYDDQGRVYQTQSLGVNQSGGSAGSFAGYIVFSGTATSTGTTTSLIDSSLSPTGNYIGDALAITSGTDSGQIATITGYNGSTKTLSFNVVLPSNTTITSVFTLFAGLTTNTFYDHRGNVMATYAPGGVATKDVYDGAGRMTKESQTDSGQMAGAAVNWTNAGSLSNDVVLSQNITSYDSASNVTMVSTAERYDSDPTTAYGDLGGSIGARFTYATDYYDADNRLVASVDLGNNGGNVYSRPGSVPSRSDTALVTTYGYAADSVQVVTLTGSPTGGTFTLTFNGYTTSSLAYNASASAVQSALAGLTSIGSGNVSVAGGTGGPYVVRFIGTLANASQPSMTLSSSLTGGSSPQAVLQYLPGGDAGNAVSVTDPRGIVTETDYDLLGRTVDSVGAFTNGVPTASTNQVTTYTYDGDGNVLTQSAILAPSSSAISTASETGSAVTITTSSAHGFAVGQTVVIAGVGVSSYNGTFVIATVPSSTTFTYTDSTTGLSSSSGGTATVSLAQTTAYIYGIGSNVGTDLFSNDVLAKTEYPDPSTGLPSTSAANDQTYTYNWQQDETSFQDQNGTAHSYLYDVLDRMTTDSAVLASGNPWGIDATVLSHVFSFDTAGRPYQDSSYSTQYGTGTLYNSDTYSYDPWGQIASDVENHGNTETVSYNYTGDTANQNNDRQVSMVYAFGRVLDYSYGGQVAISSITYSGTTATATTTQPNGFIVGTKVTISGASASVYDGTYTIASIVSPTQFTYTMTSTPTANASGTDMLATGTPLLPIASITYSAGTATATFVSGFALPSGDIGQTFSATISGATPAAFDGTYTFTIASTTTLTYSPSSAPSPTTASGADMVVQSSALTLDGAVSRVSAEVDHAGTSVGTVLEGYSYLGMNTIVIENRPEEQAQLTYVQVTGDTSHLSDGISTAATSAGTTSTLVDSSLSTSGNYIGYIITMTSGVDSGDVATVTAYNSATNTLTFTPAFGSATGSGNTFVLTDRYTGFDRFGRVADQFWATTVPGSSTPLDRFQYGYDRDGNVLYKNNLVNSTFSELYHLNAAGTGDDATAYDNLNRIENMRRGTLSASAYNGGVLDTVTTLNSTTGLTGNSQSWTLDNVGTWSSVSTDGTAANRTNNAQNEIATAGSATLTYDNNGNMTTEDTGDTIKYDAWNQVTVEKTGSTTNLTITRTATGHISTYNNGNLSDFFQDAAGQLIEFGTTTVHEDFVWGQAYVNEEVLRDRDYDGNHGTGNYGAAGSGLEERVYSQYDANYDTTSIFATGGTSLGLQERIVYNPYGASQQLDGSWNVSADPHHWYWNFKFQGEWQESFGNMYAMGAREYNVTTGTWMQKDPIGTGDGMDLYQGFGGNPATYSDPTGQKPIYSTDPVRQAAVEQFLQENYKPQSVASSAKLLGWVYEVVGYVGDERIDYVGSTAQEIEARIDAKHPCAKLNLFKDERTKIYARPVYGIPNDKASGRGTPRSAINEALRAPEQQVLDQIAAEQSVLNKRSAATPANVESWIETHNVKVGERTELPVTRLRATLREAGTCVAIAGWIENYTLGTWRRAAENHVSYWDQLKQDAYYDDLDKLNHDPIILTPWGGALYNPFSKPYARPVD